MNDLQINIIICYILLLCQKDSIVFINQFFIYFKVLLFLSKISSISK